MIKNFDEVKKQLQDLSSVVNSFKSEAVQLKVVELLFQRMGVESGATEDYNDNQSSKNVRPAKKKVVRKHKQLKEKKAVGKRAGKDGRPGPGAIVEKLRKNGFFKTRKTVDDIRQHCIAKFAYSYRSNELSKTMTRALRNNTLERRPNAHNQFEYWEKSNS